MALHIKKIKIFSGKELIDSGSPKKATAAHTHWYLCNNPWPLSVLLILSHLQMHSCLQEWKQIQFWSTTKWCEQCVPPSCDSNVAICDLLVFPTLLDTNDRYSFPSNYRFGGALQFTDYTWQHKPELSGCQVRECPWQKSSGNSVEEFEVPRAPRTLNQRELEWMRCCTHIWLVYFAW